MDHKSDNDEVKQAATREREILRGATETLNDADAVEESVVTEAPKPTKEKAWKKRYDSLGSG